MLYLYAIIVGLFESIWRRSHGGGLFHIWYDKYIQPWLKLNYRIPSIIVNSVVWFEIGFGLRGLVWWQALVFAGVVELFWDLSFGMYMSIGNHDYPIDEVKAEYDHQFITGPILNLCFPDTEDKVWGRYGVVYDFCGMWLRYTYPLVALLFLPTFTPWMLCLGLLIAINYAMSVWVVDWWNAECTSGFIAGVFFVLL